MSNSNRTSKLDRNREKVIQDRIQLLLTRMLQDEDNKYCVDCDSKGPRWASWNLGIFLCIRCAGIHRNLGVHISKVKSVNLDSWTPAQVSSMQMMGNSRGRAVYEARVPEDFCRPQSNQTLETFIRTKYEKKKYIALEWTPTKPPDLPQGWAEIIEAEKQKKDVRSIVLPSRALNSSNSSPGKQSSSSSVPEKAKSQNGSCTNGVGTKLKEPATQSSAAFDLLNLNSVTTPSPINNLVCTKESKQSIIAQELPPDSNTNGGGSTKLSSHFDLLCIGEANTKTPNDNDFDDFVGASSSNKSKSSGQSTQKSSSHNDLEQLAGGFPVNNQSISEKDKPGSMSKDSIMALFNKPAPSQATTHNAIHPGISGAFTGFQGLQMGSQSQGRPFNMNMASGVGVPANGIPAIPNNALSVGGGAGTGMTFTQQDFGIQQPTPAMSALNNPFLTDLGTTAGNASSTSNSTQQGWAFLN